MNIQMRVIGIILTALVITQVSCNTYRTRTGFNLPEAVRMGDIQPVFPYTHNEATVSGGSTSISLNSCLCF